MYSVIDKICGDICSGHECKCGDETISTIHPSDPYYCCISKNESCEENQGNGSCRGGRKKYFENFCEDQGQCPVSNTGFVAITSNCSSNHDCPASYFSSRVCIDTIDVSLESYCRVSVEQGKICPNANKGLFHQQCYNK